MTAVEAAPEETGDGGPSPLPLAALVLVVLSWGAGPVITKLITVAPVVGVVIRFGLSVPLLFAILAMRRTRLTRPTFLRTALPGIAFGINLIFVFAALQEATVAVLSVSMTLQPALLLVLAGPLFGERPTVAHVLWTLVGIAGAVAVVLGAGDELRASPLGVGLSVTAVATFSVYFILTRQARAAIDVDPFEWMAGVNIWSFLAAVVATPFLAERDDLAQIDVADLFWLVVLAYLTGVFGHVLMSWVHGYVEAARSSLYLLGMNLVAVGLAWPVHDEPVTLAQAGGGIMVLIAAVAVMRLPPRRQPGSAGADQGSGSG
jgi:drug/metabolite transporter (DMT)-like permease